MPALRAAVRDGREVVPVRTGEAEAEAMSSIVKIEVDLSGEDADILEDARALCAKVVGFPIEDISDYHLVKHEGCTDQGTAADERHADQAGRHRPQPSRWKGANRDRRLPRQAQRRRRGHCRGGQRGASAVVDVLAGERR